MCVYAGMCVFRRFGVYFYLSLLFAMSEEGEKHISSQRIFKHPLQSQQGSAEEEAQAASQHNS